MSDSPFLKFQDINGNMVPDVCPDEELPIVNKCLDCSPNPWAIVPKWKNLDQTEPFLNEKTCMYQISVLTKDKTLMISYGRDEDSDIVKSFIEKLFDNYADNWEQNASFNLRPGWLNDEPDSPGEPRPGAIESLLTWKNKALNDTNIEKVKEYLEYTEYYLAPNPGSYVQLLYSLPFTVLEELEDAGPEPDPPDPEPGDKVIKMKVYDMVKNNWKVRKGMFMYSRYYKVYKAIEGAHIIHKDSGRMFNLDDYGDFWPWDNSSHLAGCLNELDDWLLDYDLNIPNTGFPHWFTESAEEIEFHVTGKYKLKSIKVWTDRCNERPIYFGRKKVRRLARRRSWRNPTAVAFFLQMEEIERELSARVERPWLQVLKDYTYPEIEATKPASMVTSPAEGLGDNIPQCIGNALGNEFKQLGQDIFDEVFGIGDAVAYAFHKNLCRYSEGEVASDLYDIGLGFGIDPRVQDDMGEDNSKMWALATTQAYKTIDPRDQVFANFCFRMLSIKTGSPLQMMDDMWANGFERIKFCGLFDLLLDALACLMKGLSLQEALMTMLKNALKAMTAEDYGKLFVGLPPEKQDELEKLVKKNLKEGKTFNDLVGNSTTNYNRGTQVPPKDPPLVGKIKFVRPWENKEYVKAQKESLRENGLGNLVPPSGPGRGYSGMQPKTATRRTLAQKLDVGARAKEDLDPTKIMDAYIIALLEVYSDNLLSLVDRLNDFPGAQIVSAVLSTLDCPKPPLFNPGISDFLKSIVFPFCRGKQEIVLPRLEDPRVWWPKLADIWGLIWEILKMVLIQLIIKIIIMILVKICEIIGSAICKALEVVGTTVAALPDIIMGKANLLNVIRDAICGEQATDAEMENVVTQLVADLGVGGQALANKDRTIAFIEDLGASATKTEFIQAMVGDPSGDFLRICDQIIENGYPDFRDALPNETAIARFFKNIGFLVPAEMRQEMKIGLGWLGDDDMTPVNPTICATEKDKEDFKDHRCMLLEGRATEEDCENMYEKFRGTLLEDLDEVSNLMNQGIGKAVFDQMPPLVSQPGCNDGLIPYESEGQIAVVNNSIAGELRKLQMCYSRDMLGGQSSFFGGGSDRKWGMLNMMLCDTLGNPYTVHQDKVENDGDFVDFYAGWNSDDLDKISEALDSPDGIFASGITNIGDQRGAWPQYVGEWLMYQYQAVGGITTEISDLGLTGVRNDLAKSMVFNSTNRPQPEEKFSLSFERLGFTGGLFTDTDVDLTDIPQMGYNTKPRANMSSERVVFTKAARKDEPDIKLVFKDNAKGYRFGNNGGNSAWSYQYRVSAFFSDMEETNIIPGTDEMKPITDPPIYRNRPDDNIRVYISDWLNMASSGLNWSKMSGGGPGSKKAQCKDGDGDCDEEKIISSRRYEFIGVDDGLDTLYDDMHPLTTADFPTVMASFQEQTGTPPQVGALYDLIRINAGGDVMNAASISAIRSFYNSFMENQFKSVAVKIGENDYMWRYGAEVDTLDLRDFDYVCPEGWKQPRGAEYGTGGKTYKPSKGDPLEYWEMELPAYDSDGERDGTRPVGNNDAILGMSRDEWNNRKRGTHPQATRVFMLSPTQYGGTYTNPPMYAKPQRPKGWQGVIDLLYPENSQCEPKVQDIMEFGDIKKVMDDTYHRLPEDTRLRGDPDCTVEVPYNRILNRFSKATIQGLIHAAIRIYASVNFIRCLPLFTVFSPKFPENYSNIFAAYVIEFMEDSLRDAGGNFLSPFKDDEFWLAFLEMSVQTYARRVQDGEIPEDSVPKHVKDAMLRLNNMQERFKYPFGEDLWEAKQTDEAAWYETLKSYREEKNLEAILKTQYDAKLIMAEIVKEELDVLSERFLTNLAVLGVYPEVHDIGNYFLTQYTKGNSLTIDGGKIVERAVGLPSSVTIPGSSLLEYTEPPLPGMEYPNVSYAIPEISEDEEGLEELREFIAEGGEPRIGWPGPFYTDGGQFVDQLGRSYVGYYHGYTNEETGLDEYYAGEFIENNPEDKRIRALAENLIVGLETTRPLEVPDVDGKEQFETIFTPLGDVADYNTSDTATSTGGEDQPFILEKYISINGQKYNQSEGVEQVRSRGSGAISQHFPGTMKLVYDKDLVPVGIDGELGVKYGLELGVRISGLYNKLATVEISALDVPVGSFTGILPDSKILYCLIHLLRRSQEYKIAVDYGFSMKKVLGVMAIYQDMGMLPSIGEVTVATGALYGDILHDPVSDPYELGGPTDGKPGAYADYDLGEITVTTDHWLWGESEEDVAVIENARVLYTPGWVSEDDRNGFWASLFFRKWDEWDQITLRNTASKLKRIFRKHYRSRDFGVDDDTSSDIVMQGISILKERFRIQPGKAFLPAWRKKRLRPNPFNADGELCKKR